MGAAIRAHWLRLEKAGLVRRVAIQEDRRALLIRITPEGLEEARRAAGVIRGVNEKIKTGFKAAKIEAFKDVLGGILEQYKIR